MIPLLLKPEIKLNRTKRLFIKENVIPHHICDEIIAFGRNNVVQGVNKYAHLFPLKFKSCVMPTDHIIHSLLQEVWDEAGKFVNTDIEFVEPYELKHYSAGDFFGRHTDNYYSLPENLDRKITMSVQLSDAEEFEGGDLTVLGQTMSKSKGSVSAFPSLLSHEVKTVIKGERWSLISWAWGPEWK
jgi:hypothetical protein